MDFNEGIGCSYNRGKGYVSPVMYFVFVQEGGAGL